MRSSGIAETKLMAESANKRQRKVPGWYKLFAKGWIESVSSSDSETDDTIQEVYGSTILLAYYSYNSGLDSRLKKFAAVVI